MFNVMKNTFMAFLLSMLVTPVFSTAWAKTADVKNAEKRVVEVTSRIVRLLQQNYDQYTSNEAALYAMVKREVLPFIDFDAMSKLTLGKHWRTASPQQRVKFNTAFREMLVNSYAKTMLKYSGSSIRAGNSTPSSKPGYVTVRTIVTPRGEAPIKADYKVRKNSGDWKAYNVEIAGINLITNFRTNFTREVSAKGLDALIARLERSARG